MEQRDRQLQLQGVELVQQQCPQRVVQSPVYLQLHHHQQTSAYYQQFTMPAPSFRLVSPVPSPVIHRTYLGSSSTSPGSRSDSSLGCTPIVSPVQPRQSPSVHAVTATLLRPAPPGTSTLRLVSPTMRIVRPSPGSSTMRIVRPSPGTSAMRIVCPSPGTSAMRIVRPSPGTSATRIVRPSPDAATLRLIQQSPVTSRKHPLTFTPVSAVTRYTSIRPPLPGTATLRLIQPNSASRRLDLDATLISSGHFRVPRPRQAFGGPPVPRLATLGPTQTGPVYLRPQQPCPATFRPHQPRQQDGGLNEPGAYDNQDGAGCSFW
jgi:hypothetical protein